MQIVAMNHVMKDSGRLGSVPLFVAERAWTVDDAVAFAAIRGELGTEIEEALARTAAEERVAEEELAIDERELQARSESFRYEHGLISAGETETWLAERGLSAEDFGRWLHQQLCREVAPAERPGSGWPIPPDFAGLLRIHLWMSGRMEAIAEQLRRRVAAGRELAAAGEGAVAAAAWRGLDREELLPWLASWGRDERWLEELATIDGAFERLAERSVTPEARARKLSAMARSLAIVEFDLLELDSMDMAREAMMCVRDDGLALAEVARDAGFRVVHQETSLETLGPLGERLVAAGDGELVGPLESDGRICLYHVLRKRAPSLSDESVVRRVDEMLVDELFSGLTARHLESTPASPSV